MKIRINEKSGWGLVHEAFESTRLTGKFDKEKYSNSQKRTMEKIFPEYLMYIWLQVGDTRCNRDGYTQASVVMSDFFEKEKDENKCP